MDGAKVVADSDFSATPPYKGHVWQRTGNSWHVEMKRSIFLPEPGPVDVIALVSPTSGPANDTYQTAAVDITGTPSPFVLPTVPSGQALFPRLISSMFNAIPSAVQADGVVETLKADGVTHLLAGGWAANAAWTTFNQWKAGFDSLVKPNVEWCLANGYRVLLEGDNILSTQALRDLYYGASYRQQATEYAAAYFAGTGIVDGIEMDDEIGPDPAEYGDVTLFVDDWRAAGGPPIAWPNQAPTAWEIAAYSDYSSRYQSTQEDRNGMPGKVASYWQNRTAAVKRDLNPAVPTARPFLGSVSCNGEFYLKYVAGDHYQLGDVLNAGATRQQAVIAQIWLLLAHGGCWRMYAYDWPNWRNSRANGLTNGSVQQTGCWPGDTERWPGCRVAMRSALDREAALLGTPYVPATSGPWTFGRRGSLVWGINTCEHALASPNGVAGVVLTPSGESLGSTVPAGGVILWENGLAIGDE